MADKSSDLDLIILKLSTEFSKWKWLLWTFSCKQYNTDYELWYSYNSLLNYNLLNSYIYLIIGCIQITLWLNVSKKIYLDTRLQLQWALIFSCDKDHLLQYWNKTLIVKTKNNTSEEQCDFRFDLFLVLVLISVSEIFVSFSFVFSHFFVSVLVLVFNIFLV